MNLNVDLNSRLIESISQYCSYNGLELNEYITSCLTKQLALDKYGDLNEKIPKRKENNIISIETLELKDNDIVISTNKGVICIQLNKIIDILPKSTNIDNEIINEKEQEEIKQIKRKRNLKTL